MKNQDGRLNGTGVYAGAVAIVLVIAALVALAAQNTQSVTVRWLGVELTTPLIAVLLGVMLAAVILDEVIGAVWRRRRRRVLSDRQELARRRATEAEAPVPEPTQLEEIKST